MILKMTSCFSLVTVLKSGHVPGHENGYMTVATRNPPEKNGNDPSGKKKRFFVVTLPNKSDEYPYHGIHHW